MKIQQLKPNPNNPRLIKDHKFKQLVKSIQEFPEMMEKRPIICVTDVDGKIFPLGGNMRLRAIQELGMMQIPDSWVMLADEWTEEKRREFVIKDNVGFGEWDWEQLANEWNAEELSEWGLDVPEFEADNDYSDKNKELSIDDFENQNYTIKLEYTESDYNLVKEKIQALGVSPEKILYDALVSL
jgi:hypothetical protein